MRRFPIAVGASAWMLLAGCDGCERDGDEPMASVEAAGERWVALPTGTERQGSVPDEPCRQEDEQPVEVTIDHALLVSAHEVTQSAFESLMGKDPSWHRDCASCPVDSVTHDEAEGYCNALSEQEGLEPCYRCGQEDGQTHCEPVGEPWVGCRGYRLPTEAEWEHAARAGSRASTSAGVVTSCMGRDAVADGIAWYKASSGGRTHPVGTRTPNRWGLTDMAGNVYEWTADRYAPERSGGVNPMGPAEGRERVLRGGSWYHNAEHLRSGQRMALRPDRRASYVGFRCVRRAGETEPAAVATTPRADARVASANFASLDAVASAPSPLSAEDGARSVVVAAVQGKGAPRGAVIACADDHPNCGVEVAVRRAALRGAAIVVTPEYGLTQSSAEPAPAMGSRPERERAPLATRFAELADELDVYLVMALETREGRRRQNSQLAFDPEGRLVGKHHKIELFGGERQELTSGDGVMAFDTPFGRVGLLICADIYGEPRWHERLVGLRGAQILALSSMWTVPRATRWQAAFARDWGLHVVAANDVRGPGRGGGIFSAEGEPLALYESAEPGLAIATIAVPLSVDSVDPRSPGPHPKEPGPSVR